MTRLGKIARLPRQWREELNRRLSEGEMGKRLVDWLNTQPEVRAVLAAEFGGRPINEQNLSDWKQGGFEDWLRHQEARAWVSALAEEEEELKAAAGSATLAERLMAPVLVGLGRLLRDLPATSSTAEQSKVLLGVAQQLGQLLRGNAAADRVRMQREQWEVKKARTKNEKEKAAELAARFQRIKAQLFPHLDEDFLPYSANALPPELQEVLAANARLRREQSRGDN